MRPQDVGMGNGHSYNRTLAASLGFADQDKRNPLHELACHYLIQPDVACNMAEAMLPECVKAKWKANYRGDLWHVCFELVRACVEMPITKGDGQYRTTIGFLDAILYIRETFLINPHRVGLSRQEYSQPFSIAIEVKAGEVAVSDVIRQINLYRCYQEADVWVLTTPYTLSSREIGVLKNEQIHHVLLGDGFKAFIESEQSEDQEAGQSALVL